MKSADGHHTLSSRVRSQHEAILAGCARPEQQKISERRGVGKKSMYKFAFVHHILSQNLSISSDQYSYSHKLSSIYSCNGSKRLYFPNANYKLADGSY